MTQTFWNGQPCQARRVVVEVGPSPRPTWWCATLEGHKREAVEVVCHEGKFYLDNEDGSGWLKVTEGHGSPEIAHSELPVRRVLGDGLPR